MAKAAKKKSTRAKQSSGRKSAKAKSTSSRSNGARRARDGSARGSSGREPLAIQLLKQDHRTVEELFEEFEQARRPIDKRAIAQQICQELTVHAIGQGCD